MNNSIIKIGDYIIIQRHNFKKIHKFNKSNSTVTIGRDSVNLLGIENCPYSSVFKMIPKGNKRSKEYTIELTEEAIVLKDEITVKTSGSDNRNILDDGTSQKLTAAQIEELTCDADKASDIIETLISNSNTFHSKTEYSQEKYLRKKEKKYFEYFQIVRPNLRTIAEILYKLEPIKIQSLRLDTLSQIISLCNVNSEGVHLLYDSGSNGLLAAALLNAIGPQTKGKLINMHPGNMSQKQALLAMNFDEEQYKRCISINIYSVLRLFYQGCDTNKSCETNDSENSLKRKAFDNETNDAKVAKHDLSLYVHSEDKNDKDCDIPPQEVNTNEPKKPKWHFENINAFELLQTKVDSLVIASKEDPENIFIELVQFVKPGRPFVIYHNVAEPLQQLYMTLRCQSNVAAVKLTCNWMRNYQVLPERTHPEVMMNAASGFLLTGYVLK